MEKIISIKLPTPIILIFALICCSAFTSPDILRWEKLGTRIVNYNLDRDEIPVSLKEGTFNGVKLIVKRSPINLHRFVIHFSNGTTQEVLVRKKIAKGGETRVIDLKGGNRGIKKWPFGTIPRIWLVAEPSLNYGEDTNSNGWQVPTRRALWKSNSRCFFSKIFIETFGSPKFTFGKADMITLPFLPRFVLSNFKNT